MIEGFFDLDNVLAQVNDKVAFPRILNEIIDWEQFRPILASVHEKERKNSSGRKPFDEILMFKILVLQTINDLSDDNAEIMIIDRLSYRQFLGLTFADKVPDAKTIWLFRNRVSELDLIKPMFEKFNSIVAINGFNAKKGTIIDASFVKAPAQKINSEEKKELEQKGRVESWSEAKDRQKDKDAKWAKKNSKSYFGYKNHIAVDNMNKLIRMFEITDASVHDSHMLMPLLDYSNSSRAVWADSAYFSRKSLQMLDMHYFLPHIQRRGYNHKPLTEREKQGNLTRSRVRARVEHVFGIQSRLMGAVLRCVGIVRARCKIGLRNLVYNMHRYAFLISNTPSTA